MKQKELQELRTKTAEELTAMVAQKRVELAKIKAELATGRHKNIKIVKNLRRDVSQMLTVLREKTLGGQK